MRTSAIGVLRRANSRPEMPTKFQARQQLKTQKAFTLVELAFVMLIMGLFMIVALPNVVRSLRQDVDIFQELSLWTEIVLERSAFRGEVIVIRIDAKKNRFTAMQHVGTSIGGDDATGSSANADTDSDEEHIWLGFQEVSDPFFPAKLELPKGYEIDDVQGPDGEKFRDEPYALVVYPYGWIDPLTIHILDERRAAHTGFINSVTGQIRWQKGYVERFYDDIEDF